MNRLIAVGCSLTYGHGLADCIVDKVRPGPSPSKLGWVQHLGNELGIEVVNLSKPGASNMYILKTILDFEFEKDDVLVVQWTFPNRDLLFNSDSDDTMIMPGVPTDWTESYYTAHSLYDMSMRSLMQSHHASCYLKDMPIRSLSLIATHDGYNFMTYLEKLPAWYDTTVYPLDLNEVMVDIAIDGSHPGPNSQLVISKYIKELL